VCDDINIYVYVLSINVSMCTNICKENQLNEERMEVHALRDELAEEKVRLKDATSVGDNKTVSEQHDILTHDKITLVLLKLDKTVCVFFF
jgi:uncharacterized membrane protein (DUF106 family)